MSLAPAFLIAPPSRRRSLAFAAIAAGALAVTHWPDAPDPAPPPAATASIARIVHLDDAGELVREITRHPHWQLQFGAAWYSCVDRGFTDVYTLGDDENIVWEEQGMPPRTLILTDAERVALRGLPAMSAHEPYGDDEYDRAEQKYIVSFGDLHAGPVYDGAMEAPRIGARSPMGRVIDDIVTAARTRYIFERMRFLGEVRLTFALRDDDDATDVLTLRGRGYEIRHGRRVIGADVLTEEEFVDLADWALAQRAEVSLDDGERSFERARIAITVGDRHVHVRAAWSIPRVLEPLSRAIDDARYESGIER